MTNPRVPSPSREQLRSLYEDTADWLALHGTPETEPLDEVWGIHAGITVRDYPSYLSYSLPGRVIAVRSRSAAEVLRMPDKLNMLFTPAYYEKEATEVAFKPSQVAFGLRYNPNGVTEEEVIYIDGFDAREPFRASRLKEWEPDSDKPEYLRGDEALSGEEYIALHSIVRLLHEL